MGQGPICTGPTKHTRPIIMHYLCGNGMRLMCMVVHVIIAFIVVNLLVACSKLVIQIQL